MRGKVELALILSAFTVLCYTSQVSDEIHFVTLTDSRWEEVLTGEWLIGIFHSASTNSVVLEKDWNALALKCEKYEIKVGLIQADENPGLQVRFLARDYPKVFYIKEGVARVFTTPTKDELLRVIEDRKWEELELVNMFYHPFSIHLSIFSFICTRVLILYNFEKELVSSYFTSPSILNMVFILTSVAIGTAAGLILTFVFFLMKFAVQCCIRKFPNPSGPKKSVPKHSQHADKNTKLRKRRLFRDQTGKED